MKTFTPNAANIALALTLIALQPAIAADSAVGTAQSEAAAAEVIAAERKASLERIDAQIKQIEQAVENAPDQATKDEAKTRLATLKERRSDLQRDYASSKAREILADAKVEYAKVADWTKRTARDVKERVAGPDVGPADTARAAINPEANAALAQIALYRLSPSPENKADVKAALDALEDEIDRLKDHAKSLPRGEERRDLQRRVKALEKREKALKRDFTSARWDAIVGDLKSEWNRITD